MCVCVCVRARACVRVCVRVYLRLLLFMGTNSSGIKIVDLAGINFSNFAITCSIYFKMCDEFNTSRYNFYLAQMGQLNNFAK